MNKLRNNTTVFLLTTGIFLVGTPLLGMEEQHSLDDDFDLPGNESPGFLDIGRNNDRAYYYSHITECYHCPGCTNTFQDYDDLVAHMKQESHGHENETEKLLPKLDFEEEKPEDKLAQYRSFHCPCKKFSTPNFEEFIEHMKKEKHGEFAEKEKPKRRRRQTPRKKEQEKRKRKQREAAQRKKDSDDGKYMPRISDQEEKSDDEVQILGAPNKPVSPKYFILPVHPITQKRTTIQPPQLFLQPPTTTQIPNITPSRKTTTKLPNPQKCPHCDETFIDKPLFIQHMKEKKHGLFFIKTFHPQKPSFKKSILGKRTEEQEPSEHNMPNSKKQKMDDDKNTQNVSETDNTKK